MRNNRQHTCEKKSPMEQVRRSPHESTREFLRLAAVQAPILQIPINCSYPLFGFVPTEAELYAQF